MLLALFCFQYADCLLDGEAAGFDLFDGARHFGRHHDLVQNGARLLHGAEHIAAGDLVALLDRGRKGPLLFAVQRRNLHAAGDCFPAAVADLGQRALNAVVNIFEHTGPKLDGEGHTGRRDLGAGAEAARFLIDLNGGRAARHIQDLTDQLLLADADDVCHVGVFHPLGNNKRAGYLYNST